MRKPRREPEFVDVFGTKSRLADSLVELCDVRAGHACLDPCAGGGDVTDSILRRAGIQTIVTMFENNAKERARLSGKIVEAAERFGASRRLRVNLLGAPDFFLVRPDQFARYQRVVAIPPTFEAASYTRHAVRFLGPGGRLVVFFETEEFKAKSIEALKFSEWICATGRHERIGSGVAIVVDV